MQSMMQATLAYGRSAAHRGFREQEADVFRRVTGGLRAAREAGPIPRIRALADNRRLWLAVVDCLRDADNALPESLRAAIISVGLAVRREMDAPAPDLEFLISVNENIAAGLSAPV